MLLDMAEKPLYKVCREFAQTLGPASLPSQTALYQIHMAREESQYFHFCIPLGNY